MTATIKSYPINSYELDQMADGFSAFIKSYPLFNQTWFAGGIVNFASVQGSGHYLAPNEAAFEDGTKNYLNIPAIKTGLKH